MSIIPFETDFRRLGRKWQYYIVAMQDIVSTLDRLNPDQPISPEQIDSLIKSTLLPALKEGSNSEAAFIADEQGNISFAKAKQKTLLKNKRLPFKSRAGEALQERGEPLVVYRKDGFKLAVELEALNIDSVMIFRLETPWSRQYLGVCNGQDQPEPYLSEDTQFLAPLMKTLFTGISLGKRAAEAEMKAVKAQADAASERVIAQIETEKNRQEKAKQYGWARIQGDWSYLAKASQEFAQAQKDKSEGSKP